MSSVWIFAALYSCRHLQRDISVIDRSSPHLPIIRRQYDKKMTPEPRVESLILPWVLGSPKEMMFDYSLQGYLEWVYLMWNRKTSPSVRGLISCTGTEARPKEDGCNIYREMKSCPLYQTPRTHR